MTHANEWYSSWKYCLITLFRQRKQIFFEGDIILVNNQTIQAYSTWLYLFFLLKLTLSLISMHNSMAISELVWSIFFFQLVILKKGQAQKPSYKLTRPTPAIRKTKAQKTMPTQEDRKWARPKLLKTVFTGSSVDFFNTVSAHVSRSQIQRTRVTPSLHLHRTPATSTAFHRIHPWAINLHRFRNTPEPMTYIHHHRNRLNSCVFFIRENQSRARDLIHHRSSTHQRKSIAQTITIFHRRASLVLRRELNPQIPNRQRKNNYKNHTLKPI